MHPTRTLQRLLWTLTAVYWGIIFILTHLPSEHLPKVGINDKIEHLLAYGGLGGILFLALWSSRPRLSQIGILVLSIGMAYGAIDEWLQAIPFVHRDCSFEDWCADVSGVSIAVVCLSYLRARFIRVAAMTNAASTWGSGMDLSAADQTSGPPVADPSAPKEE